MIVSHSPNVFRWRWLGRVPYPATLAQMRALWEERGAATIPDTLLLLEHPPVLTVGKTRAREDIRSSAGALESAGIEVHETDRGGRVTYHGPGQLIAYPVFAVGTAPTAAAAFARRLGEVMIALCAEHGLEARWEPEYPGVWIGAAKVGAVGVRVEAGVSRHGFALNVDPDLRQYRHIVPCGITDRGVTSIAKLLGRSLPVEEVAARAPAAFARAFGQIAEPW